MDSLAIFLVWKKPAQLSISEFWVVLFVFYLKFFEPKLDVLHPLNF